MMMMMMMPKPTTCRGPLRCVVMRRDRRGDHISACESDAVVGEAGLGCTQRLSKNELSDAIKAGVVRGWCCEVLKRSQICVFDSKYDRV